MLSPKFSRTHYYYKSSSFAKAPNVVNLYLDYNCPFSAKLYLKLKKGVIEQLQEKHPNKFQFVYINVVQPWHPNSLYLNEFALAIAKLLRSQSEETKTNEIFWDVSEAIFENKEQFYDTATVLLGRNETYEKIANLVFSKVSLPLKKEDVLNELTIKPSKEGEESNAGNGATTDLKYFTRYLRNVGIHITPTVSTNNIVADLISSGAEIKDLVRAFEDQL